MSYGLYISNGTAGAVITNSNNIFNEEIFFSQSGTVTAGNSTSLTIEDVGDPSLISIDLETNDDISLSASGNTLNISNSGSVDFTFDLKVFRFQ
mgnify:CR=1 FL=1